MINTVKLGSSVVVNGTQGIMLPQICTK